MLAAKLIIGLILISVMALGIAGYAPKLDARGCTMIVLTLVVFLSGLWKVLESDRIKTVYLCTVLIFAYAVFGLGYFLPMEYIWLLRLSKNEQTYSAVELVSSFFWLGFVLVTTLEIYRKPESKVSIL